MSNLTYCQVLEAI